MNDKWSKVKNISAFISEIGTKLNNGSRFSVIGESGIPHKIKDEIDEEEAKMNNPSPLLKDNESP